MPTYLGDGSYASVHDDHRIVVTANHRDPLQATDRVYFGSREAEALWVWLGHFLGKGDAEGPGSSHL